MIPDTVARQVPRDDGIFIKTLPYRAMSRFSCPLFCVEDLQETLRGRRVWVLGTDGHVKKTLARAFVAMKNAAESITFVGLSLKKQDLPLLDNFFSRLAGGDSGKDVVVLAEDDYGPAFDRLCSVLPFSVPVLTPTGYLLPGIPGAQWNYSELGTALLSEAETLPEVLSTMRFMAWDEGGRFRHSLAPLLRDMGLHAAGIISRDPQAWGGMVEGARVAPLSILRQGGYDAVVACIEGGEIPFSLVHTRVPDMTPVMFAKSLVTSGGDFYATFALQAFADYGEFFRSRKGSGQMLFTKEKYHILYDEYECYDRHYDDLCAISFGCKLHSDTLINDYSPTSLCSMESGFRNTSYHQEIYDNEIYVYGMSYTFGAHVEDAHTVPSFLQNICNEKSSLNSGKRYIVHNKAISANPMSNMFVCMSHAAIKNDDVVIVHISEIPEYNNEKWFSYIKAMGKICREKGAHFAVFLQPAIALVKNHSPYEMFLLNEWAQVRGYLTSEKYLDVGHFEKQQQYVDAITKEGIRCFSLYELFARPHAGGESFFDCTHMGPNGNKIIANAYYELFIKNLASASKPVRAEGPSPGERGVYESGAYENAIQDLAKSIRYMTRTSPSFVDWIGDVPRFPDTKGKRTGCIVMNCNPFTLGHRHIIRMSLENVERLYIFAVQEDRSFFSFEDRLAMIREGVKEFGERVIVAPSGEYIISSASFPEYFVKDHIDYTPDATSEILIFGAVIAPDLGINVRFFGEEPFCPVTRAYHEQIKKYLPLCGVECMQVPRSIKNGRAISASYARSLLLEKNLEGFSELVPHSTFAYTVKRLNAIFTTKTGSVGIMAERKNTEARPSAM